MNHTRAQKINVASTWHVEQIKAAVRMRGTSMKQLSLDNGLYPAALSLALTSPRARAEKIISDFLQVPLYELWPERWTIDGRRIRPRYAHKYITRAA